MDIYSVQGKFGWEEIGEGGDLPYVVRVVNDECERFVSVRIAEQKLLSKYLNTFDASILNCTSVPGFSMTEAEAELLNDMNINFAEQMYGEEPFVPGKESVVRIEDLKEFYSFMLQCYNKLKGPVPGLKERCGFIRINSKFVIPYCCTEDGNKFLPLFCFERETENIQYQVVLINNWNMAYIKFCCMVQGAYDEVVAEDWCLAISLEQIENKSSPGITIEDFWPDNAVNKHWLVKPKELFKPGCWVRLPEHAPPTLWSTVITSTLPPNINHFLVGAPVVSLPPSVFDLFNNLFENGCTTNKTKTDDSIKAVDDNKTEDIRHPSVIKKHVDKITPKTKEEEPAVEKRLSLKDKNEIIEIEQPEKNAHSSTLSNVTKVSSNSSTPVELNKSGIKAVIKNDESVPLLNTESIVTKILSYKTTESRPNLLNNNHSVFQLRTLNVAGPSEANNQTNAIVTKRCNIVQDVVKVTPNLKYEEPAVEKRPFIKRKSVDKKTLKEESAMKKRLFIKDKNETIEIEQPEKNAHSSTLSNVTKVPSNLSTPDESNESGTETVFKKDESVPLQNAVSIVTKSASYKTIASGPNLLENNLSVSQLRDINVASSSEASNQTNAIVTKCCNIVPHVEQITPKLKEVEPVLEKRQSIKMKSLEKTTLEEEPAMKKRLSIKHKNETIEIEQPEKNAHSSTLWNVTIEPSNLSTPVESNESGIETVFKKDESVPLQNTESIVTKNASYKTTASGPNLLEKNLSISQLIAINAAGPSEANNQTNVIATKCCNIAPHINLKYFKNIKIKAGNTIRFNIHVTGEPAPKTKWLKNDQEIQADDRTTQTHIDYNTKLRILSAKREDSGYYSITAKNRNGEDKASIKVTILDRPSAPEGPLKISDVYAKRCKLSWKKPKDDGGRDIKNYVIEKLDKALKGWVYADRTDGPVTNINIKNLIPKHKYTFRVKAVNSHGKSDPLTADRTIKADNPIDTPSRPLNLVVKAYENDFVELDWDEPKTDRGSPITGYIIEMKNKVSSTWVKVAETRVKSGTVYGFLEGNRCEFRVRAVNKAGPGSASDPKLPHIVRYKKLTTKPKEPSATKEFLSRENSLMITESNNLKNLKVAKCSDDGLYHFSAKNMNEINQDEPSKPSTPTIIDYDNQSVTLKWEASEKIGGSPIEKYIVEKKDRFNQEWELALEVSAIELKAQVTKLKENSELQFRITAVNQAGPSPSSEPTKIHTVKHKSLKPKIDRSNLKNIAVRGGETVKYDVNIKGEPAPIVKWQLANKDVKSKGNLQIANVPYNTIITLSDTKLKDSGTYKIIAENEFGKDEATVEVAVLKDPSSRSQDLQKIKDITSNAAKDDGGKPKDEARKLVTAHVMEEIKAQTGRCIQVDHIQETEMNVKGLQKENEYSFCVLTLNKEGESKPLCDGCTTKNPCKISHKAGTSKITDWTCTNPKLEKRSLITKYVIPKKRKLSTDCDEILPTKMEPVHLRQLFVGNLNSKTTDEDIKKYFEHWGKIIDFVVVKDPQTKRSRRVGFITYAAALMLDNVQGACPHKIDGCKIELERIIPKQDFGNSETDTIVNKLFVRWYFDELTEADLKKYFSVFGNVTSALVVHKNTAQKRKFGFVEFDVYDPIDKICLIRSHKIKNTYIHVEKVKKMAKINSTINSSSANNNYCSDDNLSASEPEANAKVKKLFIRLYSNSITEYDLKKFFSAYGNVISATIIVQPDIPVRRGFGFVEFDDYNTVNKICLKEIYNINGGYINVQKAKIIEENESEADIKVKQLFVRLPVENITEEELKEYFSTYGNVISAKIFNKETGEKRRFGFVVFDDYGTVDKICLVRSHKIKGICIHVEKFKKLSRVNTTNNSDSANNCDDRSIREPYMRTFEMNGRWRDDNYPNERESGPSFQANSLKIPSASFWDNHFGNGYQQNFDTGRIIRSRDFMREAGAARPGPYSSGHISGSNFTSREGNNFGE